MISCVIWLQINGWPSFKDNHNNYCENNLHYVQVKGVLISNKAMAIYIVNILHYILNFLALAWYTFCLIPYGANFWRGEILTNLTNFQQFINIFPIKIFHLVSYSMLMIGIRQFFTRQNFPNLDSSKFSNVKILCHTVIVASNWPCAFCTYGIFV